MQVKGGKQKMLEENNTLNNYIELYRKTNTFKTKKGNTQKDYIYQQDHSRKTVVCGKPLGEHKIHKIGSKQLNDAYEKWLITGTRTANSRKNSLNLVFQYCMQQEVIDSNPMRLVSSKLNTGRDTMWTKEQCHLFLDTAYSEYKWRSMGVLAQICSELAQRVGDVRKLRFDQVNFDKCRIDIEQSKTGAKVYLHVEDNLLSVLKQQKDTFGFQPYVCPRPLPIFARGQDYTPYRKGEVSKFANQIKETAKLPKHLQIRDFRRTWVTRAIKAGADAVSIMQVTGHKHISSLNAYTVNTPEGAKTVLDKVNSYDGE